MTLDDFLTLTLPERIAWLHGPHGPQGQLSHDRFGVILGTSRQTIIGWEKPGGVEPRSELRRNLAEFSGFPEAAFSRRKAEALVEETIGLRLRQLQADVDLNRQTNERILKALKNANIALPSPRGAPRSAGAAPPANRTRTKGK